MAGEPELTGMAKHFNSVTFTGRANVAKATYGGKLERLSRPAYDEQKIGFMNKQSEKCLFFW